MRAEDVPSRPSGRGCGSLGGLLRLVVLGSFLGFLCACGDNVGRAFDPGYGGGGGGVDPATQIQVPPEGGIVLEGRPRVVRAAPSGNGLQVTTPVCVLFSESMNLASLRESDEEDPSHLYLRAQDSETPIAGSYQLLLGGRLLVFRPSNALSPARTYEIVAGKTVRDIDKATLQQQGVLVTFTTDASPDAPAKVVFSYPEHSDTSVLRKGPFFAAFAAPVDPTTVTAASLFVQKSTATSSVAAGISYPVRVGGAPDSRIVQLSPNETLEPSTRYDFVWTDAIQVGPVKIDPGPRDPPVVFTTMAPLPAEDVAIGNPVSGFASSVNRVNLENLVLDVEVPAGVLATDKVLVRAYGNAKGAASSGELEFVAKETTVGADGPTTVQISLAGLLGTVAAPRFADGSLTFAVLLSRGNELAGFAVGGDTAQDTVPPTLLALGPPAGSPSQSLLTDQSAVALHGTASEELGTLTVTVGGNDYALFASSPDGRFVSVPFFLLRTTAPTGFDLTFRDLAGNPLATTVSGTLIQRGVVTGSVAGGTLEVQVYDEATLLGVEGATVLIEPGRPQLPASGRTSAVTDANGVASFGGLAASSYTVTIVKDGYDLYSLVDTSAGYVSLPLRPRTNATAQIAGSFVFVPSGSTTAKVGLNLLPSDANDSFVQTTTSAPTTLAPTPVRPQRLLFVSAFEGVFPPSSKPTYSSYTALWGASSGGGGEKLAPVAPVGPGGSYTVNAALVPATASTRDLATPVAFDLTSVAGFDANSLTGPPQVSVLASLGGFAGMGGFGVGYVTGTTPSFQAEATYSLAMLNDFAGLGPILWCSVQASDTNGNLTRQRSWISDGLAGIALPLSTILGPATVTSPSGSFTGSPNVVYADRVDSSATANSLAFHEMRAVGPNGRRWILLELDADAATGTNALQLPDLAASSVSGLAPGTWSVDVQTRWLIAPGMTGSDYNLEDLVRFEMSFARSASVSHVIQ